MEDKKVGKLEKIKAKVPMLYYTFCFAAVYGACVLALTEFDLRFRFFITKISVGIIVVGALIGIIQAIWRIKRNGLKFFAIAASVAFLLYNIEIIALEGMIFFVTSNETTQMRDGVKYSVYEEEFLDVFTDYYEYINPIVTRRKPDIKEKDHYMVEELQEDGTYKMTAGFGG